MKKTIYLLTRGDEDIGLQVIRAYDTEQAAKQSLLALAKVDGEGSLEIKQLTPTSYDIIEEPGCHDFITVEIIERPLQKECDHESSLHTC